MDKQEKPEPVVYDRLGKKYREVKCDNCGWVIFYEWILRGRILVPCPNCAMITVMVFRYNKQPKLGRTSLQINKGER